MTVPVCILRAAGTNCDRETAAAVERAGGLPVTVHVNRLLENPRLAREFGVLVVPGGFSYGDDVAAGRIFGNQLRHRCGEELAGLVARGGVILGICNGFQVILRAGLLPGPVGGAREGPVTLTLNASGRFEDRWVWLEAGRTRSPLLEEGERITLPVAHAEGRLFGRAPGAAAALAAAGQVAFRYVDASGRPTGYPGNPNGSEEGIAGLTDPTGRVLGLMPHPERHADPLQHPRWTREGPKAEGDGLRIFRRALAAAKG
ncbi:MAG: phosphoribosylformylglycinamidine synthase I [Planctomycetales bacterium]|nr:phosphoribosylformylglycinamidine synthase I [Planctomycetales bacterium]